MSELNLHDIAITIIEMNKTRILIEKSESSAKVLFWKNIIKLCLNLREIFEAMTVAISCKNKKQIYKN